jgi:AcrR family transcriptional regulator
MTPDERAQGPNVEELMKNLVSIKTPRPAKELRDQARREEIVEAARVCVVRRGFHAASMAEIAEMASMSVGQIYRYFPNKEAIVHAIVERIVEHRLEWIATDSNTADLPSTLARILLHGHQDDSRDDQVLMMEVSAEATRNPEVAAIVKDAHRRLRIQAVAMFRRVHGHLTEQQAGACVDFFGALADGSAFRRTTGLGREDKALSKLYKDVIALALSER